MLHLVKKLSCIVTFIDCVFILSFLKLIFQSIESIRTDGTGRHTFWDFFQGRPAQTLAVFNGWFYLADEKKLWQAPQNMPSDTQNGFILKASLPVLNIYHVLQQPQGEFICVSFLSGYTTSLAPSFIVFL